MDQVAKKPLNGVNVEQLVGTIEAVKSNPDIAKFNFRAQTDWVNGGHSKTTIQGFYGALQEDKSRTKAFILEGDEPSILLGEDHGPNAVETILHALSSCLAVGIAYNAAAMGIGIKALQFELEGQLDLHAFLGLTEEKRAGYENIIVKIKADTTADSEHVKQLIDHVVKTSPVLDIIRNPVPVEIKFN